MQTIQSIRIRPIRLHFNPDIDQDAIRLKKRIKMEREKQFQNFINSLKVVYVDSKLGGYFHGMNPLAAKQLGVNYPFDRNTVAVIRNDPDREWLIYHESREYAYMKFLGLPYMEAHALTLLDTEDVDTKEEGLTDAKEMVNWRKVSK